MFDDQLKIHATTSLMKNDFIPSLVNYGQHFPDWQQLQVLENGEKRENKRIFATLSEKKLVNERKNE